MVAPNTTASINAAKLETVQKTSRTLQGIDTAFGFETLNTASCDFARLDGIEQPVFACRHFQRRLDAAIWQSVWSVSAKCLIFRVKNIFEPLVPMQNHGFAVSMGQIKSRPVW